MATLGRFKIKVFWNIGYDVIISVHDNKNKILSRDSNYIEDVVMWPKLDNSSIFMKEVIIRSNLEGFDQKNHFFRDGLGSRSVIWDWQKRLGGKLRGDFLPPHSHPSWKGLTFGWPVLGQIPILKIASSPFGPSYKKFSLFTSIYGCWEKKL